MECFNSLVRRYRCGWFLSELSEDKSGVGNDKYRRVGIRESKFDATKSYAPILVFPDPPMGAVQIIVIDATRTIHLSRLTLSVVNLANSRIVAWTLTSYCQIPYRGFSDSQMCSPNAQIHRRVHPPWGSANYSCTNASKRENSVSRLARSSLITNVNPFAAWRNSLGVAPTFRT
jgi:hypothetical protein